jgi:hypothetical protein
LLRKGETNKARALRDAVQRLRRCSGREAAAKLRELAANLNLFLPCDDPAHGQLETLAREVEEQGRPFRLSLDWAPFVLHGAPITTPLR